MFPAREVLLARPFIIRNLQAYINELRGKVVQILWLLIFAGASVVFWLGCKADADSSRGRREKTKIFRGVNDIFDLRKYVLWMLFIWGGATAVAIYGALSETWALTIGSAALMVFGGIVRFKQAAKNRASRKIDGLGT